MFKLEVGKFNVVLLHADVPGIDSGAKALEEVLSNLEVERAVGEGVQREELAVYLDMIAGKGELGVGSVFPIFGNCGLIGTGGLDEGCGAGEDSIALGRGGVAEVDEACKSGVEALNGGTELGGDATAGADRAATAAVASGVLADALKADGGGSGGDAGAD